MDTTEMLEILRKARQSSDEAYSDQENDLRVNYPSFPHILNQVREERKMVYREFTKRIKALNATLKS